MKKVVDWTFGSIFRTFGRIIAYLIFGIAISYILHSLDFRITDLFLDNVKASTITYSGGVGYQGLSNVGNGYQYFTMGESTAMQMKDIPISLANNKNGNELRIPFLVSGELKKTISITHSNASYVCTEWKQYTNGNWYCYIWDSKNEYDNIASDYELNLNVMLGYYDGGNGGIACTIDMGGNTIICPLFNSTNISYNHIYIYYTYKATGANQTINFNLAGSVTILQSDEYIIQQGINSNTNAINNQTQQQQQQHNETMNYLQDSNTTQAESDAQDFFDDFDVPDVGGLSAIITAPLNTIRSLLSSSCAELVLPLPYVDEDLRLPCMNSIYTQHFGLFFSLYQTIILAIISYRCIRSIYFDITGFTNPDDDRIEVMDL